MKHRPSSTVLASVLHLGLVAGLSVSCGQQSELASRTSVYGGKKVGRGTWANVVALTDVSSGMYCSGTAVTPTLVVTAAHCARGFDAADTNVYAGAGVEGGDVQGQYPVARLVASPRYSHEGGGNDIAYVLLKKPLDLPESAYVPVLADSAETKEVLAVGQLGHIVGFGNRDDGGFGQKYEADGKITSVNRLEVNVGGNGVDSCQGDSGGPVFGRLRSGEWRFFGVTSRGGACGTGGIYGIVSANVCWIERDSGVDLGLPEGFCK